VEEEVKEEEEKEELVVLVDALKKLVEFVGLVEK
jgi:hypothetical protein